MADAPHAHLAVLMNRETGLYHGALYRNRPTPSGSDRYLLAASLNEGHMSSRAAAEAANAAFPDVEPLDLAKAVDDGLPEGGLGLPRNACLTRIRPRRSCDPQDDAPEVQVGAGGRNLDIAVTAAQLERMLALGHVREESSSGRDPNLYYVYDHYVLTPAGRRFHCRVRPEGEAMQGGYVITWDEGVRAALEAAVRGAEDAGEVPAGSADSMGSGRLSLSRPQAGAVIARDRRLGNMTSSPGAIHLVAGVPGDA